MNVMKVLRLIFQCLACCALTGCSLSADLIYARVKEINEKVVVEVAIDSADADFIKSREVYAYIVVTECDGGGVRFPIEPWISGQRISGFVFQIDPGIVKLTGSMPIRVFESYRHPCATLEGGSYHLGKITSAPVPIDGRQ